jgi:hypothetical protein
MFHTLPARRSRRVGRVRHRGQHTVQADDFTHVCGVVVCGWVMWRGVEEEVSRATRWWAEDGLVRWRQRCGREVASRCLCVGRFLVCCAGGLSKFGSASVSHPCPWQGRRIVRSDLLSRYLLFTPHRPAYSLQLCEVNMNVT